MNSDLGKRKHDFEVPSFSQISEERNLESEEDFPPNPDSEDPLLCILGPGAKIEYNKENAENGDCNEFEHEKDTHGRDQSHWIRAMQSFPSRIVYMKRVDEYC